MSDSVWHQGRSVKINMCFFHTHSPGGRPRTTLKSWCLKKIKGWPGSGWTRKLGHRPRKGFQSLRAHLTALCAVNLTALCAATGNSAAPTPYLGTHQQEGRGCKGGPGSGNRAVPTGQLPRKATKVCCPMLQLWRRHLELPQGRQAEDHCRTLKSREQSKAALLPVENHGSGRSAELRAGATHAGYREQA